MAKKKEAVTVTQAEGEAEVGAELLAQAIVAVAAGFKKAMQSRLKFETIVRLVSASCRVNMEDTRRVLLALDSLEADWLKPKAKK